MKKLLYVLGMMVVLAAGYWFVVRPWHERWGARAEEIALKLPGDEIAPDADMVSTRAVTVRAPASHVYPWLVQLGQGRGGMYSYEWMENIARCDIHNVYRIVPELQQVQVGQAIHMGPEGYPLYHVYDVEPGRAFVLRPANPATKEPGAASWTLYVQDQGDGTSRLISRQTQKLAAGVGNFVMWRGVFEPLSFVMEQKMLRTIRDLAEQQG